jgi:2,3,4,5-tetrahydropyridine-2,6-dicarboxylate N-acetyltransferase
MNTIEIIELIAKSKKTTPVRVLIKSTLPTDTWKVFEFYHGKDYVEIYGEWEKLKDIIESNKKHIHQIRIESDRRNSAIALLQTKDINARIEPGAIIRDGVEIGDNSIIMMGAVINIGASIGRETMIDMNSVIGGRAIVGSYSHIGAGAVIAGVIEPASAKPVIIGDHVLIGANAVILEGVSVSNGAVVAAGAVVTTDVPENIVVAGTPAKPLKRVEEKTLSKTSIVESIRNI